MPLALFILLLAAPLLAHAEEKWTFIRSGPFEVWTDGSEAKARTRMVEAEQFRYALGSILGKDDLKSVWRIRFLATKDRRRGEGSKLHRVRDLWLMTIPVDEPLTSDIRRDLTRIFLDSNCHAFPGDIDQSLASLLDPLEVKSTKLSLGAPEAASRTLGWARVHLFVTDPAFSGRARVYFSNLESGSTTAVAYRNAFEKTVPQVEELVEAHLKEGEWPVKEFGGRAMSERDFTLRQASAESAALARADLGEGSYKDLDSPDAYESAGSPAKAVDAGSKSATAWFAAVSSTTDSSKIRALLTKAAELNPLWADPHAELARLESKAPALAMVEWKKAAQLNLRSVPYWQSLAEAATLANQFNDAAKAWNGAERATSSESERARLELARASLETQRTDFAISERKRAADEHAKDEERVKNEYLRSVREAESKANQQLDNGKAPVEGKVLDWWDGPGGPKQNVTGMLQRVDCLRVASRLVIKTPEGKTLQLLVRDPSKVAILNGSNQQTLGCGMQRPVRSVAIEYQPGLDAKSGTAGIVLTVEFK